MKRTKKNQKYLWISIFLIGLYFIIRLLDYGQIAHTIPSSTTGHDYASYMTQLHFLKVCGFHNECPYWYNGFISFSATPPAWFFMTLPIYILTANIQIAFYVGILLVYLLAFMGLQWVGKKYAWSQGEIIGFFLLFFGNNVAIRTLRQGRAHELFAWGVFLITALFLIYYKERPLDKKFYAVIPLYSLTILGYQSVAILLSLVFLGLFLIKPIREKITIALSMLLSFILTAFWWFPLVVNILKQENNFSQIGAEAWWFFKEYIHFTPLAILIFPIITGILFYIYVSNKKEKKKEVIFFLPSLAIVLFFFLGIIPFIPIFNDIFTNIYFLFCIFFMLFFMWEEKSEKWINKKNILLIIATIITIGISIVNTPFFEKQSEVGQDVLTVLEHVNQEDTYLIVGDFPERLHSLYHSIGPLYFNLSTSNGWYPHLTSEKTIQDLSAISNAVKELDCTRFNTYGKELKTNIFIGYGKTCEFLSTCGAIVIKEEREVCMFEVREN